MVREAEEIRKIVELAKLRPSSLHPFCQEIHFDADFDGMDMKLVEINAEVEAYLQTGSTMVLRGPSDESAVMCTKDCTFELKGVETSNSLLILEDMTIPVDPPRTSPKNQVPTSRVVISTPESNKKKSKLVAVEQVEPLEELVVEAKTIVGMCNTYLEMRKINPPLGRIVQLLLPSSFRGMEYENNFDGEEEVCHPSKFIAMEKLLNTIPGSENEIMAYLKSLKYTIIDGYVRLVESDYLYRVLNYVLELVDENSWSNGTIIKKEVIVQLSSIQPEFILEKLFDWFFVKQEPPPPNQQSDDDMELVIQDEDMYAMNGDEICRLFGEVILKRGSRFNLRDFLKSWQESVPQGLKTNVRQLEDFAIVNEDCSPATIQYLPEFNLPETIGERFSALFEIKAKWRQEDIFPFIRRLATSAQEVGVLLTKHCRVSTYNGCKVFSSKHAPK